MKIPKYQRIQNDLKNQIISGKFENGDKFYTESDLIKLYGVSSITVIRALNELVKDGYLVRQQGKGTFVSRSRKGKLVEFSDLELFPLKEEQVTVLSVDKGNDAKYLQELNLKPDEYYYRIVRLRHAADQPYLYQESYVPERFILKPKAKKDQFKSIQQRFKTDFDIHLSSESYQETHQVVLEVPETVKEALELADNEPTVLQTRKTTANSDIVLEYAVSYKHWKYYKFEIKANQ